MIELKQLRKSYPMGKSRLEVLKGIDLTIQTGELVSIMGSSGSGKSTLLNVLGVLDSYDSGSYTLDHQLITSNLNETDAAYIRNQCIGFVFQSFNLMGFKTAIENVALPLYYRGIARQARNTLAKKYLDLVGLADRGHHLPGELSGGQKQRVAIARALASEPKIILADEPTGALDTTTSHEIMQLLIDLNKKGLTIIIVTHENDIAAMTHRVIHIKDGLIVNNRP